MLAEHAVIGETSLWRHAEGLVALAAELAPLRGPLRIWSAGCATGEEPYSLALALLDAGRDREEDRILGTDVSARALAQGLGGRLRDTAKSLTSKSIRTSFSVKHSYWRRIELISLLFTSPKESFCSSI